MRLNRIGYLIREGFRSIGTHAFMSFASVTIIMACLIIMGSVSLLSLNIDEIIGGLESQNEVVAFVDEGYTDEQAAALEEKIASTDNVSLVDFVPREEAMENFMGNYDSSMREYIDVSVFRHRYVVHMEDISQMEDTVAELREIPGVVKVNAHVDYANAFISIRNIVSVVSLILIVILAFVSVFIMTNTIKLATYGRREEIAIQKMVGATNHFIRMPFIIEGLTLGLLGGILAYFAELGLYAGLTRRLMESLANSFITIVPFSRVSTTVLVAFVASGVLVGVFGSLNAIRNYLKV